jgi:hypothetical protein
MLALSTGSTPITAYVSNVTTLQNLEMRGKTVTAAAAMLHLQPLTRLTSLALSTQIDEDDYDDYDDSSFSFRETMAFDQV